MPIFWLFLRLILSFQSLFSSLYNKFWGKSDINPDNDGKFDSCYSHQGTIAVNNTLINHDGKYFEDVGYFLDHAEQRRKIAHDYIRVLKVYRCRWTGNECRPSGRQAAFGHGRMSAQEVNVFHF